MRRVYKLAAGAIRREEAEIVRKLGTKGLAWIHNQRILHTSKLGFLHTHNCCSLLVDNVLDDHTPSRIVQISHVSVQQNAVMFRRGETRVTPKTKRADELDSD